MRCDAASRCVGAAPIPPTCSSLCVCLWPQLCRWHLTLTDGLLGKDIQNTPIDIYVRLCAGRCHWCPLPSPRSCSSPRCLLPAALAVAAAATAQLSMLIPPPTPPQSVGRGGACDSRIGGTLGCDYDSPTPAGPTSPATKWIFEPAGGAIDRYYIRMAVRSCAAGTQIADLQ